MDEPIRRAGQALQAADHAVVFTGAGVSTASGIPDFRSEGGIWDRYDPAEFHYQRFRRDPAGFWEKRLELYEWIFGDGIEPNAAHETLATLEANGTVETVITQNIDGLHAEAGSESLLEIHGNGRRVVCEGCGRRSALDEIRARLADGVVRCEHCSGLLKPDVVLFGEQLPEPTMRRAREQARVADLFLVAGSSLTVEPAASLPRIARRTGGSLCIVNLESTDLSAEFEFQSDVTETLPALASAVERL